MKNWILFFAFILLGNCSDKEVEFHPKAIVIVRAGDVYSGTRSLVLGEEITDKDTITVGAKSICDLQILDSDSQVVIRLKEYSRFRLTGKQFGSKKQTNFIIDAGNAMLNVPKLGKKDEIRALTPSTTAGVRGTKYDVNVSQNGNTKINVLEGSVAMKVRVPELEKFSRQDQKSSKALSAVNDSLDEKEIVIDQGKTSEMPKSVSSKIWKDTGLIEASKKGNLEELDKQVDQNSLEEKLEKMESEDMKREVKDMDKNVVQERLKEYNELTPIEKEIINDKNKRKAVIQARYQKWESSWLQRLLNWAKGIKF